MTTNGKNRQGFKKENFFVSSDRKLLQIGRMHKFLSTQAYWSLGIPRSLVKKAAQASLCFGVYHKAGKDTVQVGYARLVTDGCTFAWLCDVYIEPEFRGLGLAKTLMSAVMAHPSSRGLRRICLATKDAHSLYKQFGFEITANPGSWMEIKNNDIYLKRVKQKAQ
ncbi:MAG: GNAT family N-acetyltransferase [Elusimicrobia bacterium]|nr:GNAT family N-acetyltransferase [Elusimicrobiota bacterium]